MYWPTLSFLEQKFCVKWRVNVEGGGGIELVQVLDTLGQIVLQGGQGGHDGRGAEAVSDEREVSEVPLYGGVEERLGPGVTEGRPVLVQQVHQLLCYSSGDKELDIGKTAL